jgi:hypothetical protein
MGYQDASSGEVIEGGGTAIEQVPEDALSHVADIRATLFQIAVSAGLQDGKGLF